MKNWTKTAGLYALVCAAALLSAMALPTRESAIADSSAAAQTSA